MTEFTQQLSDAVDKLIAKCGEQEAQIGRLQQEVKQLAIAAEGAKAEHTLLVETNTDVANITGRVLAAVGE